MLILASCEDFFVSEATNVNIPGSEPQLVVYSFISPQDSAIKVSVYRSTPYTMKENDVKPVGNRAYVSIAKKGQEFKQLTYHEDDECFMISANDFPVEAGNYYELKVESFEGEKVNAECYVPEIRYQNLAVDSIYFETTQFGGRQFALRYHFTAVADNRENYYRTGAHNKWQMTIPDEELQNDTVITGYYYFGIERGKQYFADRGGGKHSFKAVGRTHYYLVFDENGKPVFQAPDGVVDSIFIYLLQTDYHYYRFHKSVNEYGYYDEDFPFAESVHIYSNIKGGLGTFAGYNRRNFYVPLNLSSTGL
jgi:hypothetical protein